jgi:glyoxylase-like metal-dependent hydrolase (beta-lactamase superfamily II)
MQKLITAITFLLLFFSLSAQPLKITPLTGDFYIYTTYNIYKGDQVPANGMYLVTSNGVLMIDTPWDSTQFQPLLDSIQSRHHKKVVLCIATHFHEDRTGGLEFYQRQGIKTYTTSQTDSFCKKENKKRAAFLLAKDSTFKFGQYSFQTYYGGPGHSPDNIVIWFQQAKILYGGCLIKSTEASDLGNLSDANVEAWATTIKKIQHAFKQPQFIIPGHLAWTSNRSLNHTLQLIEQYQQKTK